MILDLFLGIFAVLLFGIYAVLIGIKQAIQINGINHEKNQEKIGAILGSVLTLR